MFEKNKFILIILIIIVVFSAISAVSAGLFDFLAPSKANADDVIFEAIGGDDFLNATLKGCVKISEENIPDGTFNTNVGEFGYYNAKNISYVDTQGRHGYMIVWKTTPDKYNFNTSSNVNLYLSAYLTDRNAKTFIEYSYENKNVYGIILGSDEITYSESELIYVILGLNPYGFDLSYSGDSTTTSSASTTSSDHYHTVVEDRYSLSRNDPDSYYDYYEYGDNYEIDNYLESQGYE